MGVSCRLRCRGRADEPEVEMAGPRRYSHQRTGPSRAVEAAIDAAGADRLGARSVGSFIHNRGCCRSSGLPLSTDDPPAGHMF
ncbi:Hypothetical protein NTJ_01244 [Nesidiocoris tenuis]|uniref:Uncharacterized protein n=1 Tax=Nesidiocoris tenuis TaxID=355587 RepID=A0ABN7A832_9HEMI|nr:Hypothetical protein NTJ_01244 [Nesidiocoris tenuis]